MRFTYSNNMIKWNCKFGEGKPPAAFLFREIMCNLFLCISYINHFDKRNIEIQHSANISSKLM